MKAAQKKARKAGLTQTEYGWLYIKQSPGQKSGALRCREGRALRGYAHKISGNVRRSTPRARAHARSRSRRGRDPRSRIRSRR